MRGERRKAVLALCLWWLLVALLVALPAAGLAALAREPMGAVPSHAAHATAPQQPTPTSSPIIIPTTPLTPTPRLVAGPRQSGPARLLFIGDSLTGGYYASDYAHSFPALVAARLGARIVYPGIYYGHTAANTIAAMNHVPPPPVDLAVIELGINDNDDGNLPLFRVHYADMLARLKRANPTVQLICLGIWQDESARPFNDAIRTLCLQAGGRYHDLAPLYTVEAYHGPKGRPTWVGPGDWFHPNDAGHAAIAAAALQTLGLHA